MKTSFQQYEVAKTDKNYTKLPQTNHHKAHTVKHSTGGGRKSKLSKTEAFSSKYVILPFDKRCRKLSQTQTEETFNQKSNSINRPRPKTESSQSKRIVLTPSEPLKKTRKKKKSEKNGIKKVKIKISTEKSYREKETISTVEV